MGLLDIIKGKKATNINDTTPMMNGYKHYKKATNINDTTPMMNDYKHYKEEEITKLEEQLLSIYNFNSAINYNNPSYLFPHQLILDKLEKYIILSKKYINEVFLSRYLEYGVVKLLLNDLEKISEELSIHYNILNKLEELHPKTIEILEKEKNKIKETFQSNTVIIRELEKKLEPTKLFINESKYKKSEYESLKYKINELINKKETFLDIDENEQSNNKLIELVYKLEIFLNSKEGQRYISNYFMEEIKKVEKNYHDNDTYNPIQDINRIIKEVEFIDKHSMATQLIIEEYKKLLKIKFDYLKKNPNEEEIKNLINDFNATDIYISFIQNDLDELILNNDIDKSFYYFIGSFSSDEIFLNEKYPYKLLIFFAFFSNTLETFFQKNIDTEDNSLKYLNLDKCNNILFLSNMSRETYFYLPSNHYAGIYIVNLHQVLVKNKGLSWPILKGIKEIKLTNNEFSKNILSLFSLDKNIILSKDIKSFTLENIKDIKSGNIIFQDGIETINIRNVSFKDEVTITIPKSVTDLNIDIINSNITTLVFKECNNLVENKCFIKDIINQLYNDIEPNEIKSNHDLFDGYRIYCKKTKMIQLVIIRDNEKKVYKFGPHEISNNKSILEFDNKELWKQHMIDMVRKNEYENIIRTLNTKEINIITNNYDIININKKGWDRLIESNKPFSNTILPEYGPFLKRNEEELRLMDEIVGAKVLDLGCGEGESLEYLYENGAKEIWGVDISNEQIERAKKRFPYIKGHFFNSPMEEEIPIPNNYFDYIISICSIGYTSDIKKTFQNVYKYLNDTGAFIVSWTHPVYNCLGMDNDKVLFNKSYFDESAKIITKGPDKIYLAQKNYMISTIINTAISSGLYVDKLLEETVKIDDVDGYNSDYYRKEKTENCPTTLIYRLKKIKNEEK